MAGLTPDQLTDAKLKYHQLVTGQLPRVALDGLNGDRLEFQGASASVLLDYIRQTDPTYLVADPTTSVSRPFRYIF